MPRKPPSAPDTAHAKDADSHASALGSVQESAQQIWLAGLGAFAKVQAEGSKVFESLVNDGLSLQRQTQAAAEAKLAEAASQLVNLAQASTGPAAGQGPVTAPPAQPWEKLESLFETRVARALTNLGTMGWPGSHAAADELEALKAQVQALRERVDVLEGGQPPAKPRKKADKS